MSFTSDIARFAGYVPTKLPAVKGLPIVKTKNWVILGA